jgi:hypothetical protein
MKLTIDTESKTIQIIECSSIEQLNKELESFPPKWRTFKVVNESKKVEVTETDNGDNYPEYPTKLPRSQPNKLISIDDGDLPF